tara:strand:- start:191 stop:460 length:270 start_codon:yes stop_codon:yes gene_type:complete
MKIKKELKYAEFEYDEESKKFLIIDTENGSVVELNKVYAFAFMRFVIRMAQRNWMRQFNKNKKNINKIEEIESEEEIDINQMLMFNETE